MSKKNRPSQMKAFNTIFLVSVLVFAASVYGIILLWNQKDFLYLPAFLLVVSVLLLFLEPVYYVFTKKGIVFIHFFGYKKNLSWQNVQAVSKLGSHEWLKSAYTIHYYQIFRDRCIRRFTNLPVTRQIKMCFKRYYVGIIQGEDEPPKKKNRKKGR